MKHGLFPKIRLGKVKLSPGQVEEARGVGRRRNIECKKMGLKDSFGLPRTDENNSLDFYGSCGELATAVLQGVPWPGHQVWRNENERALVHKIDDLYGHGVRTTMGRGRCLILHPSDPDDTPFILVNKESDGFHVRGWVYARDGKLPHFWQRKTGRPCYFVPPELMITARYRDADVSMYWEQVLIRYGMREGVILNQYPEGHPYSEFWFRDV
jgi:hypothetical protein